MKTGLELEGFYRSVGACGSPGQAGEDLRLMDLDEDKLRDALEASRQVRILFSMIDRLFNLLREAHRNSPEQKAVYHKKLLREMSAGYGSCSIPTNPDVVAAAEHARRHWK